MAHFPTERKPKAVRANTCQNVSCDDEQFREVAASESTQTAGKIIRRENASACQVATEFTALLRCENGFSVYSAGGVAKCFAAPIVSAMSCEFSRTACAPRKWEV